MSVKKYPFMNFSNQTYDLLTCDTKKKRPDSGTTIASMSYVNQTTGFSKRSNSLKQNGTSYFNDEVMRKDLQA